MKYISESLNDTRRLAAKLAYKVSPGTVIALNGNLGTGKTTFTQGFAKSIGITESVVSPTFKLVSEYQGNKSWLYHIDAYRMKGHQDFLNIGGEKYLIPISGITIIEWANIIKILIPDNAIQISFDRIKDSPNARQITITGLNNEF